MTSRRGIPHMFKKDAQPRQKKDPLAVSTSRNKIIGSDLVRRVFVYQGSGVVKEICDLILSRCMRDNHEISRRADKSKSWQLRVQIQLEESPASPERDERFTFSRN